MLCLLPPAMARAQPGPDKVVQLTAEAPAVAVFTSLSTPAQSQNRLDVTVRTVPPLERPPTAVFLNGRRAVPRQLKTTRDDKTGLWTIALDELPLHGIGILRVEIPTAKQTVEQHVTELALRGLDERAGSSLHSANGRFTLFLPPDSASKDARFLIVSHEQPASPLPERAKLEAGPFEVKAIGREVAAVKGVVAIRVGGALKEGDKVDYQIRRWNDQKKSWESLPGGLDATGRVAQAQTTELGTFVLTSQVP